MNSKWWQFCLVVMSIFASSLAQAQETSWSIQVEGPLSYRNSGGRARRVFIRRFPKSKERNRIEVSIQRSTASDLEAFLESQKQSRETMVKGSTQPIQIDGRMGLSLAFDGTYEFKGESFNSKRRVAAVNLADNIFLRLTSLKIFPDATPSKKLNKSEAEAIRDLVAKVKMTEGEPRNKKVASRTEESPASSLSATTKIFRNTASMPFSFAYPDGWYVGSDTVQAPGSLWVIATPFEEQALYSPLDKIEAALRVNLTGFLPELVGVEDGLSIAEDLVKQRYFGDEQIEVEVGNRALFGTAQGRFLKFSPPASSSSPASQFLVIVVDSTLLVAEFSYPASKTATYEKQAQDILNSFRVEVDRSVEEVEKNGIRFEYPVNNWELEEVATQDTSVAWNLRSDDTSLFLRSTPLKQGSPISQASFKKACELLVSRELKLTSQDVVEDSGTFDLPNCQHSWRCFFFYDSKAHEVYAMVRDGGFHLAIVSTHKGVQGFEVAQALEIFAGLEGPNTAVREPKNNKGMFFPRDRTLTSMTAQAFGRDGTFLGQRRDILKLRKDGSMRSAPHEPHHLTHPGKYAIAAGEIAITFDDGKKMRLIEIDNAGRYFSEDGRVWTFTSNL